MTLRWRHTPLLMLTLPLLILTLLPVAPAHAEENIEVNVLVFAQPEHGVSFELWRAATELRLEYPQQRVDFKGLQVEIDERFSDLGIIPSARITHAAQRLQENDYRVLLQQSWTQPVFDPEQSYAIVLKGGAVLGDHQELEGYVTIYQSEQRIRLGTHLWLSSANDASAETPIQAVAPTQAEASTQIVMLNDTRILNMGDLHYVDHPRFGMLIEIQPSGGAELQHVP